MNKTLSRVLWIIAGVLLIVAGVYCFVSPEAALSGLSLILGLAMLFSGIVDIVIFASSRREKSIRANSHTLPLCGRVLLI